MSGALKMCASQRIPLVLVTVPRVTVADRRVVLLVLVDVVCCILVSPLTAIPECRHERNAVTHEEPQMSAVSLLRLPRHAAAARHTCTLAPRTSDVAAGNREAKIHTIDAGTWQADKRGKVALSPARFTL